MTDVGMFLLIKAESRGVGAVGAPPTPEPCSVATCLGPGKQLGLASEKLPDRGDSATHPCLPSAQTPLACLQSPQSRWERGVKGSAQRTIPHMVVVLSQTWGPSSEGWGREQKFSSSQGTPQPHSLPPS